MAVLRCVTLEPQATTSTYCNISVKFLACHGPNADAPCSGDENDLALVSVVVVLHNYSTVFFTAITNRASVYYNCIVIIIHFLQITAGCSRCICRSFNSWLRALGNSSCLISGFIYCYILNDKPSGVLYSQKYGKAPPPASPGLETRQLIWRQIHACDGTYLRIVMLICLDLASL